MSALRCSLLGLRAVGRRRVANRCRVDDRRAACCEGSWLRIDGQLRRAPVALTCPGAVPAGVLPPRHPRARDGGPFNVTTRELFIGGVS